jgi:undecaprenyl-diphosphatase
MDSGIVFVAQYFLYLAAIVTAGYWLVSPTPIKIQLIVRFVLGAVFALALSFVASHLYYDPRPFVTDHVRPLFAHAADNGFPSDHALFISLLGFTIIGYSRKIGALLLAIAVAVGAARVAAHVHHPIDIIGSFVFSAIAAIAAARLSRIRVLAKLSQR